MMKGKITIISAICVIFIGMIPVNAQFKNGASYADLNDSETIRAFKEHVSTISAAVMEGRKAGSEGERMTAEYVTEVNVLSERTSACGTCAVARVNACMAELVVSCSFVFIRKNLVSLVHLFELCLGFLIAWV